MPRAANPFEIWWEGWRTAVKLGETMLAANEVVAKRLPIIEHAGRDPLGADHVELARMVGEKAAAFAQAGSSLAADAIAIHTEVATTVLRVGAVLAAHSMPTSAQLLAIQSGLATTTSRGFRSPGRALDPIHRRATANARRLRSHKPRKPS